MVLEFSGEPSAALPVLGGSSAIRKLRFHSLYETPPFGGPREIQPTTGVRVPPASLRCSSRERRIQGLCRMAVSEAALLYAFRSSRTEIPIRILDTRRRYREHAAAKRAYTDAAFVEKSCARDYSQIDHSD